VLDPGGFGAVTITKSITIDATGGFGSVLVAGTNGIVVNAPAGSRVVLRGLTLEGIAQGSACPGSPGLNGIQFIGGGSLLVDHLTVHGFLDSAVNAALTADGASLTVTNSDLRDNCGTGVAATTTVGHVSVNVADSFISANGSGVQAGANATVTLSGNTITGNAVGLASTGTGAALQSFHDNRVAGNASNGATPTELAGAPAQTSPPISNTVTNTVTTTAPTPAPSIVPQARVCTVPNLRGKTLAGARQSLGHTVCALGAITRTVNRHHRAGRIYAQSPKPGTRAYAGAIVNVTIALARHAKPRAKKATQGGATRTWVSGVGDDANPCSRTAPCKTFAGAISKTATGGTIDALDPGGFGSVTITSVASGIGSVTLQGAGPSAEIQMGPGANGITVDPGSGGDVILRDLTIVASTPCTAAGTGSAIDFKSGANLHLENVTLVGFAGPAILLEPGASGLVTMHNVSVSGDCSAAVAATPSAGALTVTAQGLTLTGDATGVLADNGATVNLSDTNITGAGTAFANTTSGAASNGVLQAWPDNQFAGNVSAGIPIAPLSFE
jgi:hypothetical protein